MSLLMDALRKAEAQKQKLAEEGRPEQAESPSGLALEPLEPPQSPGQPAVTKPAMPEASAQNKDSLPELPQHLEELDAQFTAPGAGPTLKAARPSPPPPAAPMVEQAEIAREHARKLFEAKQPGRQANRSFAIGIGLATFVAVVGIGGYFWWQLQPKGGLVAGGVAALPSPPQPSAAPISPVITAQPAPSGPQSPSATAQTPGESPSAVSTHTAKAPVAAVVQPAETTAAKPQRTEANPPQYAASESASPSSPIRVSKALRKTEPLLEQAYAAFNRGELDLAQAAWQKALAADPRNADALHGLAAISAQRDKTEEAAALYLRALEADPKDALALAGLLALKMPADTLQTESRLKTLLAEQPDSPYLNFALGNLHARSMRWAEAQQDFFKAHVAEPANPDYLFNLAVSLDQLRQPRLAVQYYNQALAAAAQQPAGFDATQVATRLKALQAGQPH